VSLLYITAVLIIVTQKHPSDSESETCLFYLCLYPSATPHAHARHHLLLQARPWSQARLSAAPSRPLARTEKQYSSPGMPKVERGVPKNGLLVDGARDMHDSSTDPGA